MTDLIRYTSGALIDLDSLPDEIKKKIEQYAVIDILKDEAKAGLKANRIDIEHYIGIWLATKSERTKQAYKKALDDFFEWLRVNGVSHPLLVRAEHADRYIDSLRATLTNNSIRLKAGAMASFYATMKRYGHITTNPFHGATLPKKEYKKAIKTDQNKTIPVMNGDEYKTIIRAIRAEINRDGTQAADVNASAGARRLLPAVRIMAVYGLRVGAIPTIENKGRYFTYTTKGGKSFTQDIKPGSFPLGKTPFKDYKVITIQKAFKRITTKLKEEGAIRYAYTCHDLRHFFAFTFYNETQDIVRLKKLLGHASLNVTDIYIQSIGA